MPAFGDLQATIADEVLGPVTSAHIQAAIQAAIRQYETEPWWFAEVRITPDVLTDSSGNFITDSSGQPVLGSPGFVTVVGQEFYPDDTLQPMIRLDGLTLIAFGNRYVMHERTPEWVEQRSVGLNWTGMPTDWSRLAGQVRLYPIPNELYLVIALGIQQFPALALSTDSNPWTNEAQDLILAAACRMLYARICRNPEMAQAKAQDEGIALRQLRARNRDMRATGRIRAHGW